MAIVDLQKLTIKKIHELLRAGEVSLRELLSMYQETIKKEDQNLHAFLEVFDDAFEEAGKQDLALKEGREPRPLTGALIGVKDNILIKGKKQSAASKILENYEAPYDATVIKKLRDYGAIFIGRTNMDEFAMGSSTENSAHGPTKNPYDLKRVPGGSSGGAAAAVSRGECLVAIGSDTGGSIRQPAAFCGVVGLKPTYGAVSRYGLVAMASSLDQIGPITRSVEDAEIVFDVIRGKDKYDATTVEPAINNIEQSSIGNLTIGLPKEYFGEGIDKDVLKKINKVIERLKVQGYNSKEVSMPHTSYALSSYYIIMPAEVSSNLARFDGLRYGFSKEATDVIKQYQETRAFGFGREVKRRIILGTHVLSSGYYEAYYSRAQKVRALIKRDFEKVFKEVDFLVTPTTPTPAFKIGEKTGNPLSMYLSDIFTVTANLAGVPAISLPSGFVEREEKKLPVGIQLIAPWFREDVLFKVGKDIELNFSE